MFGSAAPTEAAQPTQIKATAQSLPLAPGFYSLVVTSGGGAAAAGELPLPCVQLATAPGGAAGTAVEMMGTVPGNWLTKPGDAIIVKVTGGNATVLLTSYKHADQPNATLSLQVARIDDAPVAGAGPAPAASPLRAAPQAAPQPQPVPVQPVPAPRTEIQAHVQRQGDMRFADNGWAGCVGQRLWIEAFSITPVEGLGAEDIEYKGLTANGWETPWMTGGNTCGSRGLGTPLIGFSIRLRGAAAERFDCVYEGAFVSGQRSAGGQNGSPCRSDAIGDPLEGILLRIVAKPSVQPRPF